jgi:DNA-binding PadR family transcriptional regulator
MRASRPSDPSSHLPLRPIEFSVLIVLAEREDYGYGIVKRVAEPGAGGVRLAPSNLYAVLDRMMAAGLVEDSDTVDEEDRAGRRSYFRITAFGRAVARAEANRLAEAVSTARRLALGPRGDA